MSRFPVFIFSYSIKCIDAIDEYGFDLINSFTNLKLPGSPRFRVMPFSYEECYALMVYIPDWYKPYFEFAVHTGLRPSEQVPLKWDVVDGEYFSVELSRVRNKEKQDLKTESSNRLVAVTKTIREILDRQRELAKEYNSPYIFVNTQVARFCRTSSGNCGIGTWIKVDCKNGGCMKPAIPLLPGRWLPEKCRSGWPGLWGMWIRQWCIKPTAATFRT